MIYHSDCLDYLRDLPAGVRYHVIFADPPDNLGLEYGEYKDKVPLDVYYQGLELLCGYAISRCNVFWLSYYWRHDFEIKARLKRILDLRFPAHSAKTFIWRYTFGQHKESDFGSGFRYILRIGSPIWKPDVTGLRIMSERQRLGDARANPDGRVPDDVWDIPFIWDFPRVVGNCKERRPWHPTQHPEALMERIIRSSGAASMSKDILDCFLGTGTTLRVARRLGRECDGCEIDSGYIAKLKEENLLRRP